MDGADSSALTVPALPEAIQNTAGQDAHKSEWDWVVVASRQTAVETISYRAKNEEIEHILCYLIESPIKSSISAPLTSSFMVRSFC